MPRPSLRLLHCADVHLTSAEREPSFETLNGLRKATEAEEIDCFLIAGDLFDQTRQPDDFVSDVAEALSKFRVPIVAIPGNHDIRDGEPIGGAFGGLFAQLTTPEVTSLVDPAGSSVSIAEGRLQVWGRGMPEHSVSNDPLAHLPRLEADSSWHVAIAHGYLMEAHNGRSSPIIMSHHKDALASFDYLALGHRHFATQLTFARTVVTDSGSASFTVGSGTYAIVDLIEGEVGSTIRQLPRPPTAHAKGALHGLH